MPHQLLCRLGKCIIFYFFSIVKLQFRFCHICVILLLLLERNCVYVLFLHGVFSNSNTKGYSKVDLSKEDIINTKRKYCFNFGIIATDKQKHLSIMYWLPKMHKTPIAFRFVEASKQCSTKPLTKTIFNIFKMLSSHVKSFHNKKRFYSNFQEFWVQTSFAIVEKLTKINHKKNAKIISTFDFSTLYTAFPHHQSFK